MLKRTARVVALLILVCFLFAAPAGVASALPTEAGAQAATHDVARDVGAYVELLRVEQVAADLEAAVGTHVEAVRGWEIAQAAAFVRAQYRPPPVAPRPTTVRGPLPSSASSGGGGYPSEAFFRILARCEEGGNNDPFYGYFGKIDGAWAGLSWDEQVARARVLWAQNASHISTTWTSVPSCTGPPF